jgi:hypothetical protein
MNSGADGDRGIGEFDLEFGDQLSMASIAGEHYSVGVGGRRFTTISSISL